MKHPVNLGKRHRLAGHSVSGIVQASMPQGGQDRPVAQFGSGESFAEAVAATLKHTPVNIRARFDDRGDLSFMQRESDGEKQQLSNDQIDLYRYRADQIRQISDALRQGRVVLRQGRWHAMEQTVTTCEGQTIKPDLDSQAIAHIERRQSRSSVDVSVAWLEAPEGSQLLLVANSDFCRWQPNEKTF